MSYLEATKAKLCGAALLGVLALAGCGSSEDSTTSTSAGGDTTAAKEKRKQDKQSANEPCTPRRLSGKVEDPPRRSAQGKPVPIEVGKTKLTLEVERTAFPRAIPVRFSERPPFKAPQGSMLVALTYSLDNDGPGSVKPSENLNAHLTLRAAGARYPYAAELPCGIPITASWSLQQGGENPARPLAAGEEATVAVVFIVPKQESGTRLSLVVPNQVGIALRPPA
jgi:hypothetical protein